MRLHYACDGRVGYVKKILAAALRRCLEDELQQIDVPLLERIFSEEIWQTGVSALNPFNAAFKFRRLDRGGEPFQQGQLATGRASA